MRRFAPALLLSLLPACAPGEGAVYVTVGATGLVRGVDHLQVVVTNGGRDSLPVPIPLAGAPVDIPPPQSFQLRFDKSRRGPVTVAVEAQDRRGNKLAEGSAIGDLQPSHESELTVTLEGMAIGLDGGADTAPPDMAFPPDLVASGDLVTPPDLLTLPDLKSAPDLTTPPDLIVPPDFTTLPDLTPPPDLVVPPDFTTFPPPVITGVMPASGPTTGGITLTISGNEFYDPLTVTVAGVAATNVKVLSKTQATATLPPKPGAFGLVPIAVTNPDGKMAMIGNAFSYYPGTVGFLAAKNYASGGSPNSIVAADFNGDQKLDLAVANYGSDNVSVLLGAGNGTFGAAANFAAGTSPRFVTAANLNGDARPDLVVATDTSKDIRIFLGNGNGTFTAGAIYPTGTNQPTSVSIGDYNGDSIQDLAAVLFSGNVIVRLGNGDGTFQASSTVATGLFADTIATADLDSDARLDLLLPNPDKLTVLHGNGNGTFQAAVSNGTGRQPDSLAIADFNADGSLDVATANFLVNDISVLLNNRNGTLGVAVSYPVGGGQSFISSDDFNADGKKDIAVASGNNVGVLVGRGDGTFGGIANFGAGSAPIALSTGDFNGDGKADLAAANSGSNDVSILLNSSQ